MGSPLISVIVPTFNRAKLLERCLKSVLVQSFRDFEVIVSDDGSTDNTSEVAEEFSGSLPLRLIKAENFGGPARPRNRALQIARGEYVAFLDSDDWWGPRKLECCMVHLRGGSEFVYHDVAQRGTGSRQRLPNIRTRKTKRNVLDELLCSGLRLPNSSVITRRDLLLKVDGFCEDRDLIAVEDLDCWLKISRLTEKFSRVPGVHAYYWYGSDKISTASMVQTKRLRAVYARHVPFLPLKRQEVARSLLHYRIARICDSCGEMNLAKRYYNKALTGSLPLIFKIKALLLYLSTRKGIQAEEKL